MAYIPNIADKINAPSFCPKIDTSPIRYYVKIRMHNTRSKLNHLDIAAELFKKKETVQNIEGQTFI